jgi:hypothetical protein
MKYLLQAMRLFHYMVGITAPEPKDERKVLLLWIASLVAFLVIGVAFAYFIVLQVFR